MNSSSDSNTGSAYSDPIVGSDSVTIEECNEFYEDDNDIDDEDEDGMDHNEATGTLPRPPTKPNVVIDDETICPVCAHKAADGDKHHLHYGGICCYSCRAFFRRAHQSTKTPNFTCRKTRSRAQTDQVFSMRQCQLCRYKKCLEIGMEAKWVLTSGQKKIRFRNFLKKRKTKRGNTQEDSSEHIEGIQDENSQDLSSIAGSLKSVQSTAMRDTRKLERNDLDTSLESNTPRTRLFRSNSSNNGNSNEDVIEPIEGSTQGLTSRQTLRKHKFLQPSWLQPSGVEKHSNNYREATSQLHRESSAEKLSHLKPKYSHDELLQSPYDNKRYKLDIESMNHFVKSYPSKFVSKNYISQKAAIMSRRLSSSDMTLNVDKTDDLLHNINSRENVEALKCRYGSNSNIFNHNASSFLQNTKYRYPPSSTIVSKSAYSSCENNGDSDLHTIHNNRTNFRSVTFNQRNNFDSPELEQLNKVMVKRKKFLTIDDPSSSKERLIPFVYPHTSLSASSTSSVGSEPLEANSYKTHEKYLDNGRRRLPPNQLIPKGLMSVSPNPLIESNNEEQTITFHSYSKQFEKHNQEVIDNVVDSDKYFVDRRTNMKKEEEFQRDRQQCTPWQNKVSCSQQGKVLQKHESLSVVCYEGNYTKTSSRNASFSPNESDSLDVSSYVGYNETQFESSIWLHNVTYDRKKKLAKIDKIFEEYVPAMRTTDIDKHFVNHLIALHKRKTNEEKYSNDSSRKSYLLRLSMAEENENNLDDAQKLGLSEVLSHFGSLEESFIKFARANDVFKTLCESDQIELLSRNSILFVQYLFSRYFSSEIALEQLSWLLKGCGISLLPIEYIDLQYMSHITFEEFNTVCKVIDTDDQSSEMFERYSSCIENIKDNFKYPQYYNALIALLLLFSNDESYNLIDQSVVESTFQETKELAITGYEEFVGFGINSLNLLMYTLRDMAYIFKSQKSNYEPSILRILSKGISTEECFEKRDGISTQIKAVDFSKSNLTKDTRVNVMDLYINDKLLDGFDYQIYIDSTFNQFQRAYLSITSGFVLSTLVDLSVGRTELTQFVKDKANIRFGQVGMGLFLDRFRLTLRLHPEFTEGLCDFDRSALWRSNYLLAGAICLSKLESATSGREQFMYVVGQLDERKNEFWALEFEGYHGLRSVDDAPLLSLDNVCCQRLNHLELEHYHSLLRQVMFVMKDPICFQLISMIMLLDTTNLIDYEHGSRPAMGSESNPSDFSDVTTVSLSEAMEEGDVNECSAFCFYDDKNTVQKGDIELRKKKSPSMGERFKGIKSLQKFYILLLRKHCLNVSNTKLRILSDDDKALNRIMFCIKQLAQYVPVLM